MPRRKVVTLRRSFFLISTFCLLVTIIVVGKPILAPIALSLLFAFILNPVVRLLEARGVGRGFAVGIIVTLVFTALLGLSSALVSQLQRLAMDLPTHSMELEAKMASLRGGNGGTFHRVWEAVDHITAAFKEKRQEAVETSSWLHSSVTQSYNFE